MKIQHIPSCILYILSCLALLAIFGCGRSITSPSGSDLLESSKGYILYVFAKRTEVMIDLCKSDGISRGTKLDVFRTNVPNMDEPVKLGEITVEKIGKKMSKARVTAITSSLKMERGDRIFPHLILVVSDASWIAYRNPEKGWRSEFSLPNERDWEHCRILTNAPNTPEIRQLVEDTNAKPVWHPSVVSQFGDVFFRKVFRVDAEVVSAKIDIICGGIANIYLNDSWVGEVREPSKTETKEWPKTNSFKAKTFLRRGRNLVAIQIFRDQRSLTPPVLFVAITIQTKLQ